MAESLDENNLNIKVHEYTLENYPYYPTGHDIRTISIGSSELEDCNQITTEEHANVNYNGLVEGTHYYKTQKANEAEHKNSLNTKLNQQSEIFQIDSDKFFILRVIELTPEKDQ
jgi:hypothetical protein